MSKLDEIIKKLAEEDLSYYGDSKALISPAKAQIKELMLEIVGENEARAKTTDEVNNLFYRTRDGLRVQLRERIKSL